MTRVARPARTRKPRQIITGPERDQLRAAVVKLNAEHYHDPEIGDQLGIPRHTVRALREEAGVAAIPKPEPKRRRIVDGSKDLHDCPACGLSVDVVRDTVEDHQRLAPSDTWPFMTPVACPAGGGKYSTWPERTPA